MRRGTRQLLTAGGIALGGAIVMTALARRARRFDFRGRVVIITGGSRGLGLVLARHLADAGGRIALCARTMEDLDAAVRELHDRGAEAIGIRCDVTDRDQVQSTVNQVLNRWGRVDALFNVAGIIQVGPLDAMTREDFQQAMDIHCWGPLNTVLAVLPAMRRQGGGRIANVSSIGGKQAVPHMLPYAASKFALVGLSNGLRAELARENIWVTTVCPSLMRTGSPRNALFKGQHRKEYAWFSIGDALPVVSMSADRAARQILHAARHGKAEIIAKHPLNLGIHLQSWFPGVAQELARLANHLLPTMDGIGRAAVRGYESESALTRSWLTRPNERAAMRNNEMRPHPVPQRQPVEPEGPPEAEA